MEHHVALAPDTDIKGLAAFLNACDFVVARAGGGLFEIAAHGKPVILVPIAESANNHQMANAYAYQNSGAGVVIEEPNLLPGIFVSQAKRILGDSKLYSQMVESAKAFNKPEAAKAVATDILSLV